MRPALPAFGCAAFLALGTVLGAPKPVHAADYVTRAESLLAKGETRAAVIELRNAIKQNPHDGAAHYQLAKLALMLGDAVAAEREARAAKDQGYDPGPSLSLLLDSYLAQGRSADLLRDFPAGNGAPDIEARIAVGRGQAELALGRLDRAGADFATASRLAPHAVYPLLAEEELRARQGRLADAEKAVAAALAIAPRSRPALLRKAGLLLATGDAKGAIAILEPLGVEAPGNPQVQLALANAYLAAGEHAKAEGVIKAALAIVPGSAEGAYLQAVLAVQSGHYDKADALLQKLAPVMSHFPQAYLLEGLTKAHRGQWAEAEDAAQRFLARFPGDPRGERLLAQVALGGNKPEEALAALAKLPPAERENPATLGLLGRAHAAAGDYAAAEREFTTAAKLAPHLAEPRVDLALVQLRLGNLPGAIDEYQKALAISPNDVAVRRSLVGAEIESGAYEQATKNLDLLKKQEGSHVENELLRGQLQLAKLDLTAAHATYAAILQAHPGTEAATLGIVRAAILAGKTAEAKQRLDAVLTKNPANRGALALLTALLATEGKYSEIDAALERAYGAAPNDAGITAELAGADIRRGKASKALDLITTSSVSDQPVMLGLKANAELALGKRDAAEATLRMLLARVPNDAGVRVTLAKVLVQGKDFVGARKALEDGVEQTPRDLQLLQALVGVASAEHGAAAGIAEAKTLANDPSHQPEASVLEGDTYMAQRKFSAAADAYRAVFAKNPSSALALRLASALRAAGKSDAADTTLEAYLAKQPHDVAVGLVLASSEIQAGKLDAAASRLEKIIALQPNNAVALNDLAWIRGEQHNPDALRLAERAYFLSGDSHIADTLGWILSRDKPDQTGVVLLRQAHAATPSDPTVAYHLAVALSGIGETKEAVELLKPLASGSATFKEKAAASQLLEKLDSHS